MGAAFGLGGVLRFPALCLEYGGAFVVAYAAVCVFAAFPLLCAELSLGRRVKSAFPLKAICPCGGAVGGLSAINSAAMCLCYAVIICVLSVRACTFYANINYGYPADMPQLSPFIAALVFIALAFFLTRRAGVRAALARAAVIFQAALFAVLAVRGLTYPDCPAALGSVLAVGGATLCSPGVWLSALGQALLSLSLAAGVMPSFAADMPQTLSPARASAAIIAANFFGSLLCAVATLSLAAGSGNLTALSHSALSNALTLYPAALAHAFSNGYMCGAFGTAFYLSLTLTAFVSALSLARPAYVWASCAPVSRRTSAFGLCAALFALCLPFALGVDFSFVDSFCCNIVAPLTAAGELGCFLFYALTKRKRGDRIDIWKILNT